MIIEKILKNALKNKVREFTPAARNSPRAALIFGGGSPSGIGGAVAQRVAREGIKVYVAGRNKEKIQATAEAIRAQGGDATAVVANATSKEQIEGAFEQVKQDGFALDLVVHNVGTNRPGKFLDVTAEHLEKNWRADCLSGFLIGQQAIKYMQPNGRGTLIFTGASASMRGKAGFASFSAAKAGLRSLAQSMAREFGPHGIHVVHVVIDGMVNGDRLRSVLPGMLDSKGESGSLNPDDIAETYWQLYQQHRTAWTHEIDLRPCKEVW
ncbi:SDR family NAD(P)-dependent oxidoreductase [Marinobacter sp. CA1]|uniref:SDR family NAD(P)-dependent oxidoreductase n=1 Tax=Marinobacter sp. CA1 TaxID=2817656 RepID=UPI001D07FCDD|nr:SDR family NAD(P)-dependent oxidoreductase [Marinobacter sp. CA1]UDL07065.1 SDR family NAD(P)-dependent oxidoreductase [Marinobacter sp. CA1]